MLTSLDGTAAAADPPPGCATTAGVTTCVFAYTEAAQLWTVPAGVTNATFDVFGAAGGAGATAGSAGGNGGEATATFHVSPGQRFEIVVGGKGGDALPHGGDGAGGFNGGGGAGDPAASGGGGGGSDVRIGACAATLSCDFSARIIVAGGGGGGGNVAGSSGGAGGGPAGGSGAGAYLGGGGTQSGGGGGGAGADDGSFGSGGDGIEEGGGGGGGWYGGGGAAGLTSDSSSGGGGSGYLHPSGMSGTMQTGARSGDGLVTVTFTQTSDLGLSMNALPNPVKTGRTVTYTISVHNFGVTAPGVVVTNVLPSSGQFVSIQTSHGSCATPAVGQTGTVTCAQGSLVTGGNSTVQIVAKIVAPRKSIVVDTASVTTTGIDPNPANNSSTVSVVVK
jgi:uncharacterized repeat protein (TIGR01451 family)